MKLLSLAFALVLATVAPLSASAIECTAAQIDALGKADDTGIQAACPSLFDDGVGTIDPTTVNSFTTDALAKLAPCKDKSCLSQLQQLVDRAPDCTVAGLNVKGTYRASVQLCTAFTDGDVSVEKATSIFGDVIKNVSSAFEELVSDGNSDTPGGTVQPGGASTVTSSPGPTRNPTSAANAPTAAVATLVILMAATLVVNMLW